MLVSVYLFLYVSVFLMEPARGVFWGGGGDNERSCCKGSKACVVAAPGLDTHMQPFHYAPQCVERVGGFGQLAKPYGGRVCCMQAMIKVVFLAAVIGVVGSKAPTAFHSFNKAGTCVCMCGCVLVWILWF